MSIDQKTGAPTKLADELKHVKFTSLSWTHDHAGFFYHRYPAPEARDDLGTEVDSNVNKQMWCVRAVFGGRGWVGRMLRVARGCVARIRLLRVSHAMMRTLCAHMRRPCAEKCALPVCGART
jgi:hypothetical protein